jgi:uncharacterized protein YggT (Ycf19 family)
VSTFIAIFFDVALAACAARSMRGEDTKVGEGISAALRPALIAIRLLPLGVAILAATVVAVIVVSFISSALGQIFRVAVYQYAVTGQAPGGFDGQTLQSAFEGRVTRYDPVTGHPL